MTESPEGLKDKNYQTDFLWLIRPPEIYRLVSFPRGLPSGTGGLFNE